MGCPSSPAHTPLPLVWHLSSPVTLDVPRSTIRSTSPVRRPRCQRSESSCRWEKRRSSTPREVNCCTRIHRKVRRLLTKPGGTREAFTTWSWGMRNISPTPRGLRAQRACGKKDQKQDSEGAAVGETDVNQGKDRVPHTCTASAAPLEELEEDISGNSPGQGAPRSLRSQQVHCGLKVPGFTSNTQVLTTQLPSSYNLPR